MASDPGQPASPPRFDNVTGVNDVDDRRRRVITLPNAISAARIAASPALAWLILHGQWESAAAGFVLAGVSDFLDGFIAKTFDQQSVLGSFLDPIADKVLVSCVAIPLAWQGVLPAWIVTLMVSRDVALVGGVLWMRSLTRPPDAPLIDLSSSSLTFEVAPTPISKANLALQVTLMGAAMACSVAHVPPDNAVVTGLCLATGVTTVVSSSEYLHGAREMLDRIPWR